MKAPEQLAAVYADRLVIVGCGFRKLPAAAAAADMYTGPYVRSCLATARAIARPADIRILSARYGLLQLGDVIDPYDVTIGDPGAIGARELAEQADARGLRNRHVIALCGARYADLIGQVWADVWTPLANLGIGQQRHVLATLRVGS